MSEKVLKIVIFGVQGAGKGTQAERIAKKHNIPWISPGVIFRKEIKNQTELGKSAAAYIDRGKLVPDEVTNKIIEKRLGAEDCKNGYILDGYPRNLTQLGFLDKLSEMSYVFNIKISDEEAIERLSGRRVCLDCGEVYNLKFKPPKNDELCDKCGKKLVRRHDDTLEAIQERLSIYHKSTEPLLAFYRSKGILYDINGEQPIAEVEEKIEKILGKA